MNWERTGQWHETLSCGRYTVSACKVMERFKFEAWYRHGGKDQNLGIFEEAAQARKECENHVAKQQETA